MARKTILVCDNCGKEVPESRGAVMRLNYTDARRGSKQADLCDDCAAGMPGQQVARRGRRPKSVGVAGKPGARVAKRRPFGYALRAVRARRSLHGSALAQAYEVAPEAGTTMDRWVSRSSSGRRTSARSRCSWSATSTRSSASRGSSSRTASTSTGSSVTSFGGVRRCSPARSGRSTTSSAYRGPARRGASRRRSSALAARRAIARRELDGLRASAATAGFADTLLQTIGELESALVDVGLARSRAAELVVAYRERARRARAPGSRRHAPRRRRAAPRRSRRVVRRAGLRVRLRGSDRRRVGAARGARRANGRHRLDPVRARARRVRGARADGRGSRRARGQGASRSPAPAPRRPARRRSPTSSASSSPTTPPRAAARRLDPLPRGRRDAREPSELLASEVAALLRGGLAPERSRSSASRPTAGARRSRRRSRSSGAVRRRARSAPRRHRARPRAALAAPLRVARRRRGATSSRSCARRSRARAPLGRLRRRAAARARRRRARRGSTRRASACAARPCRRSSSCARGRPGRGGARARRGHGAERLGLESPPTATTPAPISRAYRAAGARARRAAALAERGRESADDVVAALERTRVAPESPATGRVAVLDHERARTRRSTSSSCSGSRRARSRDGPAVAASSTTTLAASSEGGSSGRTRCARPLPLLHDLHAGAAALVLVREAAGDEGAPRAEPVLGGRQGALRRRRRPARDATAAALGADLAARVGAERARAPPRASCGCGDDAEGATRSRRQRLVAPARPRACGLRPRDDAAEPGVIEPFAAKTVFSATELERFADCSSAWLVERVIDRRRSTPSPTRSCAARCCTRRCTASTRRSHASSTPSASRPRTSRRRSRSCTLPRRRARVGRPARPHRAAGGGAAPHAARRSRGLPARRGRVGRGFVPRRLEVAFGSERAAPELQRGLRSRTTWPLREDRPDRHRPVQRPRDRPGLQVGEGRALRAGDRPRAAPPDPALRPRAARPRRRRAARRRLPRARRARG